MIVVILPPLANARRPGNVARDLAPFEGDEPLSLCDLRCRESALAVASSAPDQYTP
jgi:hypothetical protein